MADNPPDGLVVIGTDVNWADDFDYNQSTPNLIGDGSVEYLNDTPTGDPGLEYEIFHPVEGGGPYRVWTIVQADSVAGGDTVTLTIEWFTAAKASISSDDIYDAVLPGTGAWYDLSGTVNAPSTARFCKVRVVKANNNFTMLMDYINHARTPIAFRSYRSGLAVSVNATTLTKVGMNTDEYDYGSVHDDSSNLRFDVPVNGVYSLSAGVSFSFMSSGEFAYVNLRKNGAGYIHTGSAYPVENGAVRAKAFEPGIILSQGDYIEVYVWHDSGAPRNTALGSTKTYFNGALVE